MANYIDKEDMLDAWLEAKAQNRLTPRLAGFILTLCEHYSRHKWFVGYSFREDMVAEAVMVLSANWYKFDPTKQDKPNVMAYYTTGAYRSFLAVLHREKQQQDIKDKLNILAGGSPSFNTQVSLEAENSV